MVRRAGARSDLASALASGRVGFEAACLVSTVTASRWCGGDRASSERAASEAVEAAWIERAEVRTYKHLREEVSAVELLARKGQRALSAGSPTEPELGRVRAMERLAKSGEVARETLTDVESDVARPVAVVQMTVALPTEMAR